MTAEEMKLSMYRTWVQNRDGKKIPTHYIVGSDGSFLKINELDVVLGATQSNDANWNGIHIEVVGNFNETIPTDGQYAMVKQIVQWIREKYPDIEIKLHKDFQQHTCPGKNFDMSKVKSKQTQETIKIVDGYEVREATRYYSPEPNQSHYYKGKTYSEDVCTNCGCGGDCSIPANGIKLKPEQSLRVVACPTRFSLGQEFEIKGLGVVKCVDRGSAIQGNKLDIRAGYGEKGLNVIETTKRPAGTIYVKIL